MAGLTRIKSDGIGDNCDFDGEGTLVLDSTNNRVGIGTSSPQQNLQINDSVTPAIRFSRDTSYYWDIGHTNSDFQFNSESGGTIMHLNFNGNVGIGTTSPSALLHLAANAPYITFEDKDNNQDWQLQATAWFALRDQTNNAERLRIDSSGRVGIASGSQDLSVFNANGSQDLVVYSKGTSGLNAHAGITLLGQSTTASQCSISFADGTGGAQRYAGSIDYFHSNDSMGFRTGGVGSRILITSDGRVCMGTTSATASRNLTLAGLTNDAGIQISGTTSGGNCYITNTPGSSAATYIGNTNSQKLNFVVGGNVSSKMTIDSSGNLGVGTTSVDFSQFGSNTGGVAIEDVGSTSTGLMIGEGSNDNYLVAAVDGNFYQSHYGSGSMIFGVGSGTGTERMRLANSGELLLGTTTAPAQGELLKVEKKSAGTQGAGIKLSGTYSLPDEGSQTFTVGNCALIFIAENNTGDGAMFFCTYKASAVSKVSDPHDRYANSDTDGKICVFKTANSNSVVLKNRCGATKSFTIGKINTSD